MSKMKIRSFEEENKRRKNLRVILLLVSIPFLIAILLYGFKTLTMFLNADASISAYEKEDFPTSQREAEKQKNVNIFQQWLAYYNTGTAMTADGQYQKGIAQFETALELVPEGDMGECKIRANLAIAYERYGDEFTEKGADTKADGFYTLSRNVIAEAPMTCFPPQSGAEGNEEGQSMEQTDDRVDEKQNGTTDGDGDPSEGEEGEEEGENSEKTAEEKIGEQMEQSNEDRQNQENQDRGEDSGEAPVDKPW